MESQRDSKKNQKKREISFGEAALKLSKMLPDCESYSGVEREGGEEKHAAR